MAKAKATVDIPINNANLFGFEKDADVVAEKAPAVALNTDIDITLIDTYPEHPFRVVVDDALKDLAKSIKIDGQHEAAILRPSPEAEGRYEMIAGHRRLAAIKYNGGTHIKADVRQLTDMEAVLIMADTNTKRRQEIYPSERAFASKLILATAADYNRTAEEKGIKTRDIAALSTDDSARTLERWAHITTLIPDMLDALDTGKIKFIPAVALSYLGEKEQIMVYDYCCSNNTWPNPEQSQKIKDAAQLGELNSLLLASYLEKPEATKPQKITIKADVFKEICGGENLPAKEMESKIVTWGTTYAQVAAMMPNATDEQISSTIVSAVQKQLARERAKANDIER